ncbi:hypothetical protein PIB30_096178, partial [Stylosanthes scabra]|nr:hypothetical protein [Stylosanthes scabra]
RSGFVTNAFVTNIEVMPICEGREGSSARGPSRRAHRRAAVVLHRRGGYLQPRYHYCWFRVQSSSIFFKCGMNALTPKLLSSFFFFSVENFPPESCQTTPFLSEAASAIKSRFEFHHRPTSDSMSLVQNTPDLRKSAAKDSLV